MQTNAAGGGVGGPQQGKTTPAVAEKKNEPIKGGVKPVEDVKNKQQQQQTKKTQKPTTKPKTTNTAKASETPKKPSADVKKPDADEKVSSGREAENWREKPKVFVV